MRQLIKYPGSKWTLAKKIVRLFPEHHSYLEPFFGSGAVLFTKKPSKIETINDLDGNVVNLFDCIRADPEKLAYIVATMPYARDVFNRAYELETNDRFEQAALFAARCDMGHGFRQNGERVGFKMDIKGREAAYAVKHWNQLPDLILECGERLKSVQIENRPAVNVIKRFNGSNVLIYADPPYVLSTRHGKMYSHEMSDEDHEELLNALLKHKGPVVLSGYDCDLYKEKLHGWKQMLFKSRNQLADKREESVWTNFDIEIELGAK